MGPGPWSWPGPGLVEISTGIDRNLFYFVIITHVKVGGKKRHASYDMRTSKNDLIRRRGGYNRFSM